MPCGLQAGLGLPLALLRERIIREELERIGVGFLSVCVTPRLRSGGAIFHQAVEVGESLLLVGLDRLGRRSRLLRLGGQVLGGAIAGHKRGRVVERLDGVVVALQRKRPQGNLPWHGRLSRDRSDPR